MQTLHLYYHSSIIWLSHKSHCSSLSRWPTFLFFFRTRNFPPLLTASVLRSFLFFGDFPAIYKLWNSPRFYDINVPAAWSTNIPRKNTLRLDTLLTIFENVLLTNGCSNPSSALTLFLTFSQNFFLLVSFRVHRAFPTLSGQLRGSTREQRIEKMRDSRFQNWVKYYKNIFHRNKIRNIAAMFSESHISNIEKSCKRKIFQDTRDIHLKYSHFNLKKNKRQF